MNLFQVTSIVALLLGQGHSFAPISRPASKRPFITQLHSDVKYGVVDGSNMEGMFMQNTTSPTEGGDTSSLQAVMDRMIQPRPHHLFLAEKAAEVAEHNVASIFGPLHPPVTQKEKIVILGTGWGAASFLKTVDDTLYDVTVISPRNHFVFTPMLAGASVGTLEFRSITEPVREVRCVSR